MSNQRETTKKGEKQASLLSVPRAGVEPARVAPLVFETSASTDSAIWAFAVAKVLIKFELTNFFAEKFLKR